MQAYDKRPGSILLVIVLWEFYNVSSANAVNDDLLSKAKLGRLWLGTVFTTGKSSKQKNVLIKLIIIFILLYLWLIKQHKENYRCKDIKGQTQRSRKIRD